MDSLQIPDQLTAFVERHGFASMLSSAIFETERSERRRSLPPSTTICSDAPLFASSVLPPRCRGVRSSTFRICLQSSCRRTAEAVKDGRDGWFESKNAKTALTHATNDVPSISTMPLRLARPWHLEESLRLADLPTDLQRLSVLRQPFRDVVSVYRVSILGSWPVP